MVSESHCLKSSCRVMHKVSWQLLDIKDTAVSPNFLYSQPPFCCALRCCVLFKSLARRSHRSNTRCQPVQAFPDGEPFVPADHFDACNQPILTISLSGRKLPASSHEISQLPIDDFAALWTVSLLSKPQSLTATDKAYQHSPTVRPSS